jgi:hypothetical protein
MIAGGLDCEAMVPSGCWIRRISVDGGYCIFRRGVVGLQENRGYRVNTIGVVLCWGQGVRGVLHHPAMLLSFGQ